MSDDQAADLPPLPARLDPRREPPRRSAARMASIRTTRIGKRRGRRSLVIGTRIVAALVSISILLGAGVATTVLNSFNSKAATAQAPDQVAGNRAIAPVSGAPKPNGQDENIVIVGNDSRVGYTKAQLAELSTQDDGGGVNTDTIMLVHVPADGSEASVVSFPRDSYVSIPGYGKAKINSAYSDGYDNAPSSDTEQQKENAGQSVLIATLSQLTGLKIDHFVQVSLLGFYNLTNALGGIQIDLCTKMKDPYSGFNAPAGVQTLMGQQALQFVRQRHGLPNGDLDRIKRQEYFFGAVIRKIQTQNLLNISNLSKLTNALASTISYDPGLDPLALADQMRNIGAGNVQFRTIPLSAAVYGNVNGVGSIVQLASDATLKSFFANLDTQVDSPSGASASTTTAAPTSAAPTTVAPNTVSIDIVNATGTPGRGSAESTTLSGLGFAVGTVNSGTATAQTSINYPPAMLAQANTVLANVPGAVLVPNPGLTRISLSLGSSFNPSLATPASTAAAPTTLQPPTMTAADSGKCIN